MIIGKHIMSTTTTQLEQPRQHLESFDLAEDRLTDPAPDTEDHGHKLDRKMYLKLFSAGFSFFVAGVSDGSIGALIPYIIREYSISTAIVSAVYDAPRPCPKAVPQCC